MVPKLVAEDIPLLHSLLSDVFPGVAYRHAEMAGLRKEIATVCSEQHLVYGEGDSTAAQWVEKVWFMGVYKRVRSCYTHHYLVVGIAAVPDTAASSWSHDGWSQWQW